MVCGGCIQGSGACSAVSSEKCKSFDNFHFRANCQGSLCSIKVVKVPLMCAWPMKTSLFVIPIPMTVGSTTFFLIMRRHWAWCSANLLFMHITPYVGGSVFPVLINN